MQLTKLSIAMLVISLQITTHGAYADSQNADDKKSDVTRLENILVIGEGTEPLTDQLAGSYDIISRDELDYEHPDDTYELFNKAPGVYIARYNQGLINTDVAIRGFAGDGVTPHAKLLIDGIPFNLLNGYGEIDQLFPLDIKSIELFKGSSDARYGLFNVAGNYNVSSRSDIAKEIKVTTNSFNAKEFQGYAGLESGRLTHNYFLGVRQSNGYRDHTDIEKIEASGKWFYALSDDSEIGLSIRHSTYEADSPGYFDVEEDARNNPKGSAVHSREDGGDKTITHYGLHFDKVLSDSLDWSTKVYYNDIERNRWVRFRSDFDLQERVDDQKQTGFITTFDWQINKRWSLNAGADAHQQDIYEARFIHADNLRSGPAPVTNRAYDYEEEIVGAFVSVEQTPSDLIRWNVGVRVDQADGEIDGIRRSGATIVQGDLFDYGTIVQPKANLFITPNDDTTFFINYGRSFQHPYGEFSYIIPNDVSTHDAWELGSKWFANDSVELRLSYWQHKAEDEFNDLDSFQQVLGDTERKGIDLGANIAANDSIDIWLNYSLLDSEIVDPVSGREATKGNELRSIPDYTASLGVKYEITSNLTTRVHVDAQGDYYVNENNQGGKFGGYTIVSAGLDYEADWGNLTLQVNNLFDEYYEYVYDFGNTGTANVYSPGDGLNASLTYSYKFD